MFTVSFEKPRIPSSAASSVADSDYDTSSVVSGGGALSSNASTGGGTSLAVPGQQNVGVRVEQCMHAQPRCKWSKSRQRLLWKLENVDPLVERQGSLHARLKTNAKAEPLPIDIRFLCPSLLLSQLRVESHGASAQSVAAAAAAAEPGVFVCDRVVTSTKSGKVFLMNV
jgi:hypothetical protein